MHAATHTPPAIPGAPDFWEEDLHAPISAVCFSWTNWEVWLTSAPQRFHHEEQDPLLGQEDHRLRRLSENIKFSLFLQTAHVFESYTANLWLIWLLFWYMLWTLFRIRTIWLLNYIHTQWTHIPSYTHTYHVHTHTTYIHIQVCTHTHHVHTHHIYRYRYMHAHIYAHNTRINHNTHNTPFTHTTYIHTQVCTHTHAHTRTLIKMEWSNHTCIRFILIS